MDPSPPVDRLLTVAAATELVGLVEADAPPIG
jgi:hypothetical protein